MSSDPRTELADYSAELRAERAEELRWELAEERGWLAHRDDGDPPASSHQLTLEV